MVEFRPNHFPTVGPVAPEAVVGRYALTRDVLFKMRDRKPALLLGPRRIGKTSIVEKVLAQLGEEGYLVILVDFRNLPSLDDFTGAFYEACCQLYAPARGVWERLKELGRRAEGSVELQPLGPLLNIGVKLAARQFSASEQLREVMALPQRLATEKDQNVIVAFDEFQLCRRFSGFEDALLAEMKKRGSRISWLFLGSQASLLREMFGNSTSPLYKAATEVPVPDPAPDEWTTYLRDRFKEVGIDASACIDGLIRVTGGYPHSTMIVAASLYQRCVQNDKTQPLPEDLEASVALAIGGLEAAYDRDWIDLDLGSQIAVQRVALGRRLYHGLTDPESKSLERALEKLLAEGVLVRRGRGQYRLRDQLYGEYIVRYRRPVLTFSLSPG